MALEEGHWQREVKDDPVAEIQKVEWPRKEYEGERVGYLTKGYWFGFLFSAFFFLDVCT